MKLVSSSKFLGEYLERVKARGMLKTSSVIEDVRRIVESVRKEGDKALLRYTLKFDGVDLTEKGLEVPEREVLDAYDKLREEEVKAIKFAAESIRRFHKAQIPKEIVFSPFKGVELRQKFLPLESIGVYAPGGIASYPSTVLMCAIPARVAGVDKIFLCSPPSRRGEVSPYILVAAHIAGVDKIFRVGGAQAIAALAYGTQSIPKVDKIVGPGNVFVNAAKLEVSWDVAIDLPAGPSEIAVIADGSADPELVACDLVAQAEHDVNTFALLLTDSERLATEVQRRIEHILTKVDRRGVAKKALEKNGYIVTVKDLEEAVHIVDLVAPEHVQVLTENPQSTAEKIRNAGAIFVGGFSPVALGDYSSGLNHVLPTGGYAKVYSPLSVRDFLKAVNILKCDKEGFELLSGTAIELARMEGLEAHAYSLESRRRF
ncbi:histidinol dehydrogenase [Candidatus Bathyarchaeota archaeon B24-2]|nr:MAG: histidinol dehydrogenase [Candidatus Bathyarchaeota archaeon B24-2]